VFFFFLNLRPIPAGFSLRELSLYRMCEGIIEDILNVAIRMNK